MTRRLRWLPVAAMLVFAACSEVPEEAEQARGVLGGGNVVLGLTIVAVVVALLLIGGAIALDRFVTSRAILETADEVEEEPDEEVVAGITVRRGSVPKWLYGFYVLIPLFAMLYVFNSGALEVESTATAPPAATEAPSGPSNRIEIAARNIQFDKDSLEILANTEISVVFENQEAVPHNFAIYETEAATQQVFATEILNTPGEAEGTFTSPGPGTLFFRCDVHPTMSGDVIVSEGEADAESPASSPGASPAAPPGASPAASPAAA